MLGKTKQNRTTMQAGAVQKKIYKMLQQLTTAAAATTTAVATAAAAMACSIAVALWQQQR